MPGRIPPALAGKAQRLLSAEVLDAVKASPRGRLPDATWNSLSDEQRQVIAALRKYGKDGFGATVAEGAGERERTSGARAKPTPFAGTDPISPAQEAPPNPDPVTGLDPTAMAELFGGVVDATGLEKFEDQALLDELRTRFFVRHVTLDYRDARHAMFTVVDNEGGAVEDVYGGRRMDGVTGIPRADGPDGMNAEHSWPQSQLKAAGKGGARSNLHHLFPTDTGANGRRANHPFGWVKDVKWEASGSQLGTDETGKLVFTPPARHRGDVARAMFWVAAAYELRIPDDEEAVLKQWAKDDPVDERELQRNDRVAKVQGDPNPFVLMPELVDKVKDF